MTSKSPPSTSAFGSSKLPLLRVLREQRDRVIFRLLNVRLIERVDSEDDAGGSDGDLPEIELLAEVVRVVHVKPNDRMSGRFEREQLLVDAGLRIGQIRADVNEGPVVGIIARRAERLAFDRDDPFAELPGRFRDELFGPRTERLDGAMRDDRELVAPVDGETADRRAEANAGRVARIDGTIVGVHCAERAVEQQVDVVSGDRRGRDPDERERGIATADVRIVLEVGAERLSLRLLVELRAGIGDRDEVAPSGRGADLLRDLFVEVGVERVGLGRRAALARDNEERRRNLDLALRVL